MSFPWIPDAKVYEAVAAILMRGGTTTTTANAQYAEICAEANRLAVADLTRILALKGYSADQINSWDDRGRYSLDQAIFWALTRATGLGNYTDTNINKYDRRAELERAPAILIGGVPVKPGPSEVGGIAHGRLAAWGRLDARFRAQNCRPLPE